MSKSIQTFLLIIKRRNINDSLAGSYAAPVGLRPVKYSMGFSWSKHARIPSNICYVV